MNNDVYHQQEDIVSFFPLFSRHEGHCNDEGKLNQVDFTMLLGVFVPYQHR